MPNQLSQAARLLPPAAVIERTTLSRTTLWRMVKQGEFPAPIQISRNRVAWHEATVEAWIAAKMADA